ncbi:hypothetical protein DAEQUDRAFT_536170 [Daedalea quercina L-15889]|uniref:Uncharacterized protein n=1 Tax=Daedalea quercina L-15889 TaxID=1314783 RepID=A0A165M4S9_9APHY|nr:hypothetical protein DAEQUDRAFT_536170 [Daedalea quercina L-15889]
MPVKLILTFHAFSVSRLWSISPYAVFRVTLRRDRMQLTTRLTTCIVDVSFLPDYESCWCMRMSMPNATRSRRFPFHAT